MSDLRESAAPAAGEAGTVFRLIYRSHSRIPDDQESAEFGRILSTSRANNAGRGLTGALMVYDHWFAQALEGPRDAVLALFEVIKADPRHDAVSVREQGMVPGRVFARWAMAHVGEHGRPDIALTATRAGIAQGAAWKASSADQESVLTLLRDLTRGYGLGA